MKGGENRIKIIEALKESPYNMNQLANKLGLNYRTIKHHIDILVKEELLSTAKKGKYGNVFFIHPDLEQNMNIYDKIINKIDRLDYLKDYVSQSNFYQHVIEHMNVGVILTDQENNIFFMNGAASGIFGFPIKEVLDTRVDVIDSALFDDKKLSKLLKDRNEVQDHIKEIEDRTGKQKFVNITISPILNPKHDPIGRCYVITDITQRKRAQDRIKQLQELSQAILENIPVGINIKDRDYNVIFQNQKMDELFGKIKDKTCFEHYWKREDPCNDCQMIKTYKSGEVHSLISNRDDDRTYLIIQVPFEDDNVLEIIQDITEEKMFETALLNTRNLFNDIMDNVSDELVIINIKDFTVETANATVLEKYGGKKRVIGKHCHEVFHNRKKRCNHPDPCPVLKSIKSKRSRTLKHSHCLVDGKKRDVTITYYPIMEPDGSIERVIILMIPEK
jgi:PAS domain S-box-containing protein